jgi:prevent-host-death family protein
MAKQFSIAEAKSNLPAIIHSVEDGPYVQLTRHGKPVAVLLSIREYDLLVLKKKDFWSALKDFRKTIEKEGIQIRDVDFRGLRDTSFGREKELSE